MLKDGEEGYRAGLSEAALAGHLHGGAEALELPAVLGAALALFQQLDALEQLGVAHAAGCALAAGLVGEELEEVVRHRQHVPLRADHDDRAAGGDVLEGQLTLELGARHTASGG